MPNYIDGFVFPLKSIHLNEYKKAAEEIASIWKEHGALSYCEYQGEDFNMPGTKGFHESVKVKSDEVIIFGWVEFESREARDLAHAAVTADKRMIDLVQPITDPANPIFDANRMIFGGFKSFIR